jgi:ATP-binding cassette subfamily B protein
MTVNADEQRDPGRLRESLQLVLQRYAAQVKRRPALAIPALVLPAVGDILTLYAPTLVVARLLAEFARHETLTWRDLFPYILTFAGLWLCGQIAWRLAIMMLIRVEVRGLEALYIETMDELLAKDLSFFHDNFAGSLTKRALGYARRFEDVFDVLSLQVSPVVLPLVFVSIVLWQYSAWLVVALLGLLSITVALVIPRVRLRRQLVDIRETASNRLAGHMADSILNAEAVRAFAREDEEARIHAAHVLEYGRTAQRSWDYQNSRVDMITSPMFVITNTTGLAVALAVSGGRGQQLATVFVTFSYFATATRVMWEFNRIYRNFEGALTDAAQFAELLLDPPAVADARSPEVFAPADSSVELRNVDFRYTPRAPLLFHDFSLRIEPGVKVGVVGRSGGGKTTLTRLLLRFVEAEAGEICIGGQRIDRIPQVALRRAIAYVPQDPSMFHRTIAENIRVGRPGATDAEVRRAAMLAHAAEFIEELPAGYDTLVGERGIKLSGGQRQRVAIARAILKDAPILVLDEATSSLDSESEALIQDALWSLLANRTAVVIAHRLSTVRRMDRLVILDHGRIAEDGTHDRLLERGGIYAMLWSQQSGGFLADDAKEVA